MADLSNRGSNWPNSRTGDYGICRSRPFRTSCEVPLAGSLLQAVRRRVAVVDLVAGVVLELDTPGAVFLGGGRGLGHERGAVADLDGGDGGGTGLDDAVRANRGLGQRERALTVDVDRRDLLADRRHVSLCGGVTGLLALVQEHRDGDRSENADDDHDDEKLDQGEALVLLVHRLTDTTEH